MPPFEVLHHDHQCNSRSETRTPLSTIWKLDRTSPTVISLTTISSPARPGRFEVQGMKSTVQRATAQPTVPRVVLPEPHSIWRTLPCTAENGDARCEGDGDRGGTSVCTTSVESGESDSRQSRIMESRIKTKVRFESSSSARLHDAQGYLWGSPKMQKYFGFYWSGQASKEPRQG